MAVPPVPVAATKSNSIATLVPLGVSKLTVWGVEVFTKAGDAPGKAALIAVFACVAAVAALAVPVAVLLYRNTSLAKVQVAAVPAVRLKFVSVLAPHRRVMTRSELMSQWSEREAYSCSL